MHHTVSHDKDAKLVDLAIPSTRWSKKLGHYHWRLTFFVRLRSAWTTYFPWCLANFSNNLF